MVLGKTVVKKLAQKVLIRKRHFTNTRETPQ